MITRRGIGFVVIGVSVFFVASATRVGWLHVADALLWGAIAMSAALPWITLPQLRAVRRVEPPRKRSGEVAPVAGESVEVKLEVENPTHFPRFFVSAHQPSSTGDSSGTTKRFFFARLPARGTATATTQVECDRRGWREFDQVMLESRLPFGLFRRRRRVGAPGRVLVYPKWYQLERLNLIGSMFGDEASRRRARRGDETAGSRRYIVGDSVRDIHWKNTARTGRTTVKQYDAGAEESIVLAFDSGLNYGDGEDSTLEYSASITASAARTILQRNGTVRLAIDGSTSEPIFDWPEVMQRLALVEENLNGSMAGAVRDIHAGQRLLATVSGRDQAAVLTLSALARRGASVAAVVLEGFVAGDGAEPSVRTLEAAGVKTVTCRNGQIEDAIAQMELGRTSVRTRTSAPTVVNDIPGHDALEELAA